MKSGNPIPNPKIAEYVQRILVLENFEVTSPFILPLYANAAPTLLFQTSKGEIGKQTNYLTLFGQTVFPETLTLRDNFILIAYFFKPFALHSLFGVSAQELTDNPVDLKLLPAKRTAELQERLLNADSTEEMIALLDDYIFSLVTRVKTDMKLIQFATEQIGNNPSKKILVHTQKELCLTERTFQRMFEKNIGISPNLFRRISQFNAAFNQLNTPHFSKLTDIAFEHGYADQSHYIRAFKEFTNITPGDYLRYSGRV
jgi:AraC-like DNA-binding protein